MSVLLFLALGTYVWPSSTAAPAIRMKSNPQPPNTRRKHAYTDGQDDPNTHKYTTLINTQWAVVTIQQLFGLNRYKLS